MIKKFFVLITLFLLSIPVFSQTKKEPKYVFRIASEVPAGTLWHNALMAINKELAVKTNGEVRLQVFAGGVMGDQSSVINKILIGQLDGATFSNTGMQLVNHDFGIVGFPLIMRSDKEYDYMIEQVGNEFVKKFKELGYSHLCWTETGPIYIYSKKSIASEDDIRNAKAFVLQGDKITEMLFKEIKATPIPVQTSDILTSLKTGQIDTVFSPPYGLIAMQWHSSISFVTDFPMTFMLGSIMVNNKLFDSMPKEYQAIMSELFKTHFEKMKTKIRQDNVAAQEILRQNGVQSVPVSVANQNKFFEVGRSANEKLITQYGYSRDLYNRVYKMMEDFRNKK